ncbi:TetR/AcrR family transcriptional regulator [Streptomyces sp. T-3]|nr:TetR/AcrR family transcriptional regulator [Streptomyces sp. T-3]
MAKQAEEGQKPLRKGMLEKRQAITRGARTVFGREGYTRASIDAIAAEAGVSSRTLYNHFGDKEGLFRAVLLESAAAVTEGMKEVFDRHFRKFRVPEEDLVDLALEWVGNTTVHPEHFALVRQIIPEASRLPAEVLEEWQRTGPQAGQVTLRNHLLEVGRKGLLAIDEDNVAQAAWRLSLFIGGGVTVESYFGALPLAPDRVEELVREGVELFLHLYGNKQA